MARPAGGRVGVRAALVWALLLAAPPCWQWGARGCIRPEEIVLPAGFSASSFGGGRTPKARSLAVSRGDNGGATIVYVSTRKLSNVYAIIDDDSDGTGDRVVTVIDDKWAPNGIAWRDGSLYVAQVSTVWRYDGVDEHALKGEKFSNPVWVSSDFPPNQEDHSWKFIRFGPDGKLYVPVGAPCDICQLERFGDIAFGTLNRMNLDGSGLEIYATGIRNTVGFDWHPSTGELWFTDNGINKLGDDLPDDELNVAFQQGLDFGFPYCHTEGFGDPYNRPAGKGGAVPAPGFDIPAGGEGGPRQNCSSPGSHELAAQPLGPHVAALGMRFYTGSMFPERYRNTIFIALRGSYERSNKIGYEVINVRLGEDQRTVIHVEKFASGWLKGDGQACGRPVDVEVMPDGALLVSSDDITEDVFRIAYNGGG